MTCRIDRLLMQNDDVVLRISGQITGSDIDLLRAAIDRESKVVAIDLRQVSLVDRNAVALLARCESRDVELRHCPPYVREWITRERKQS
jgi:ABC-type transporter Mla MlaB component